MPGIDWFTGSELHASLGGAVAEKREHPGYKCDQCGKYKPLIEYFIHRADLYKGEIVISDADPTRICSPSCLVELAWEDKERQFKLSKSNGI